MELESLATDARLEEIRKGHRLRCQLSEITNGLALYEKVSAIFLLCETPRAGFMIMEEILTDPNPSRRNNIFYKWLAQQITFSDEHSQNKLAELLAILQNYGLGKIMGYSKNYLIERFQPKNNLRTYWIPGIRKVLYNLCEDCSLSECRALVAEMGGAQTSADPLEDKYLEYKLLKWNQQGIISMGTEKVVDLLPLIESLRSLNFSKIVHDIEVVVEKTNCAYFRSKSISKLQSESNECYEVIDSNHLGLCVIINQKHFSNSSLPRRLGTDKDAERLMEVFTAFGFSIRLHVDLTLKQLVATLSHYAATMDESSSFFVLVILSHGSENIMYTSDSLPVDINTIEMIFQAESCPNLLGKPKIFIVQSCQGEKWQRVLQNAQKDTETDNSGGGGASREAVASSGPQRGDSLIAWSTVRGFASFRDKYNGSWYIQELCNQLWKFGDAMDLVEILTKVNNNLRNKVYGGQFMVPSILLSLRAKVRFPNGEGNLAKGRRQMIERLLFEKYFRDFLTSSRLLPLMLLLKQQ